MKDIETFIEHRFKEKLDKDTFEKYLKIARFCDKHEDKVITWTWKEAFDQYRIDITEDGLVIEPNIPGQQDFRNFFKDDIVNDLLLGMTIQGQKLSLRQFIANIKETKNLSQGDMKAINLFIDLVNQQSESEHGIIYIQLLAPVRFGNHDNKAIVESLSVKEE